MSKTNLNRLMYTVRDRRMFYDNEKTSIINYYLSRKLKDFTINEILDVFEEDYIKNELNEAYENNQDNIKKLGEIGDLSKIEMISFLNEISANMGRRGGDTSTPKEIIDLSLSILSINESDTLLDVGSGYGTTLLSGSNLTTNLSGVEINRDNVLISKLLMDIYELDANIELADALLNDNDKYKANKVFVNTPLGLRMSSDRLDNIINDKFKASKYKNLIKAYDLSWLFALDIIENTDYEKFVMVVTGSSLFNVRDAEIRKNLVKDGKIESVIALPGGLLYGTTIPIYLIVFSHNNKIIRMVDAQDSFSTRGHMNVLEEEHIAKILTSLEQDTKNSKSVTFENVEFEDFSLVPHLYGSQEFPFEKYVELGKIVKTIQRGTTIRKNELEALTVDYPTDFQYLMLQNFQDGIIEGQPPYLKEVDEKLERFLINEESLIVSRLSPFKVGVFEKHKTKVIANGNLFVLKVDESQIEKSFLAAYLQSDVGLKEMDRFTKGAAMKTISITDLKRVRVPKISKEKQILIGEEFNLLNAELKAVKQRHKEIMKEKSSVIKGGM